MPVFKVVQISGIESVNKTEWNDLLNINYPFLRHEFLSALEQSGSICAITGWQPAHLLVKHQRELVAVMPLYIKHHSWGEYVFDQQWAEAYLRYGQAYYPKLVTAIPLTPCTGPRLVVKAGWDAQLILQTLFSFIKDRSRVMGISSWHCLFTELEQAQWLQHSGMSLREGVQFQWFNQGYSDFQGFLETLTSEKRKMLKRERRKVYDQGIKLLHFPGKEITELQWESFFDFYRMTYLKKGMQPYLNLEFFHLLASAMPENILMVLAIKNHEYVAAALSIIGGDTLYGRYWGCRQEFNFLHFETCYYQGIDFCLEKGLKRFDSGAQGEHKISRGFVPVTTYSAHWIKDVEFAKAIDEFLIRERNAIKGYKEKTTSYLPFKQEQV
jgi:uncharacterized protein